MNLFVIRHAESANNALAESTDYTGFMATRSYDPPLTERGAAQADALAAHLTASDHPEFARKGRTQHAGYRITRIVCSPMLRTLQTAAPVARALGLPLEVWLEIHEQGGLFEGDPGAPGGVRSFPGMTRAEMQARFGDLLLPAEITPHGWWRGGYEDYPESAARAVTVAERLLELAATEPDARLAFVSHGTFLNQMLRTLFGMPDEAPMYFFHANTGVTRVEFVADGMRVLRYTNRIAHLPSNLMSR